LPATFVGRLPCPDCPAIRYELTLAADSSYAVRKSYEGKGDRVEHEAGSWGYSSDRILLVLKSSQNLWSWFVVQASHTLRAVDARGESIDPRAPVDLVRRDALELTDAAPQPPRTGASSEPVTVPLSGAEWTLTELEGKPVRPVSKDRRRILLAFDDETRTFSGQSGCNDFDGEFTADWRMLALTPRKSLRACRADASTERALNRAIKATRAYRVTGTILELFDERGGRIARFDGARRASSPPSTAR
jgi:heat shock protein HslJ